MDEQLILNSRNLNVFYQPIINTKTMELEAVEALIRLKGPHKRAITPQTYVTFAENNNLIEILDSYVLTNVCKVISANQLEDSNIKFHINMSPIDCDNTNLASKFSTIADRYHIPHNSLVLELLETRDMTKDRYKCLNELKDHGFMIGLDDYGVGCSGLRRLLDFEFKFNCLKLDKSLVDDLAKGEKNKYIYRSIVKTMKDFGMCLIQEGVETQEQFNFVKYIGVDMVQGYLISKAVPEDDYLKLIETRQLGA